MLLVRPLIDEVASSSAGADFAAVLMVPHILLSLAFSVIVELRTVVSASLMTVGVSTHSQVVGVLSEDVVVGPLS